MFTFSTALIYLQQGYRVCRSGWNGKGMWIKLTPGSVVQREQIKKGHALWDIAQEFPSQESFEIQGHLDMRTADGKLCVGWLASQLDMAAGDWQLHSDHLPSE